MAQVAVFSQTNTKHINIVWAERTVAKIFNLLVHPVTSRLYKVKEMYWILYSFTLFIDNEGP
jgi:hypothetical protein